MPGIQDFIQMATQHMGISEATGRSATGALLGLVKDHAAGPFKELAGKIPGAGELAVQAAPASGAKQEAGGMLGGLMGAAGSALGGKMGAAMSIGAMLSSSGLNLGDAGKFVSMFLGFVKDRGGDDLLGKIVSQIPELKKLAG